MLWSLLAFLFLLSPGSRLKRSGLNIRQGSRKAYRSWETRQLERFADALLVGDLRAKELVRVAQLGLLVEGKQGDVDVIVRPATSCAPPKALVLSSRRRQSGAGPGRRRRLCQRWALLDARAQVGREARHPANGPRKTSSVRGSSPDRNTSWMLSGAGTGSAGGGSGTGCAPASVDASPPRNKARRRTACSASRPRRRAA